MCASLHEWGVSPGGGAGVSTKHVTVANPSPNWVKRMYEGIKILVNKIKDIVLSWGIPRGYSNDNTE